ncbi:MAG TPA: hypothetical protein DCY91_14595 [Cyanobacteria bacterium UBA11370]|nr:hypothetical protein [Cyanobacteria bacterium UBA11370]
MSEPLWISENIVKVIHANQIVEHGGRGASQSCKLPTASKSEAIQTRTRKARVLRQSAQADIVCVAAISNRQVLLLLYSFL